jgi:hypothetical protein
MMFGSTVSIPIYEKKPSAVRAFDVTFDLPSLNTMTCNNNNTDPGTVATAVTNHDDEEMSCLTEPAYQPDLADAEPDKAGDGNVEEPTEEEEPNWNEIMQHDPARTEVPIFLAGRERKEAASDSYSTALDALHDSVNKSAEALVETVVTLLHDRAQKLVDFEEELTRDYVQNDKRRDLMEKRLEENARAAQGMFANLLKRVSAANQPNDLLAQKKMRFNEDENEMMNNSVNNLENDGVGDGNGTNEGQEPDWQRILQHEPAQTEVPVFLAGRERREAACSRFQSSIEDYHAIMDGYAQELTQTVADLYNNRMVKLNEHEQNLKHEYIFNDESRGKMLHTLQESSASIQKMFQEMIMRVMLPEGPQDQSLEQGILTQATSLTSP